MKRFNIILVFLLLAFPAAFMAGCAAKTATAVAVPIPGADSPERLRADLELIFSDLNFSNAQWGVEVLSLDRGEVLFERNSSRLYMPASNNKIITAVTALLRLGPGFRYQTGVLTDGGVLDGVLRGNLVVAGSGDPTFAPRFHDDDPFGVFREWATALKAAGVRKIDGDILGDGRAFEESVLGEGWEWDDLPYGYAAPVSALQFNENLLTVEISPGAREGDFAEVKAAPLDDYMAIRSSIRTGPPEGRPRIEVRRGEGSEEMSLSGEVPLGAPASSRTIAVRYPTRYFLHALRHELGQEGIDVSAAEVTPLTKSDGFVRGDLRPLCSYTSPLLPEILKPLLKVSQNLYAETLVRTLGLVLRGEGSFEAGKEVVEEALQDMAIEPGTYNFADGSGLSRHNLISADLLVRIFRFIRRHRDFSHFYDALPVAGVDGTIRGRFKGTKCENNVHAKTGSIANVRSLSGFLRTADGEMLAFSMIANNFLVSSRAAEYVQDSALERLAGFSRPKN